MALSDYAVLPYYSGTISRESIVNNGVYVKTWYAGNKMYSVRTHELSYVKYAMYGINNGGYFNQEVFACIQPTSGIIGYSAFDYGSSYPTYSEVIESHVTLNGTTIYYVASSVTSASPATPYYSSLEKALNAFNDGIWGYDKTTYPITYIPVNSTLSGPESAASGDTVSVDVTYPDGYIYQERGISVYDTNGAIAHSYDPTTGKLTFIMP